VFALFALIGAGLIVTYVRTTAFNARTHDLGSHLHYIKLVEQRHTIPNGTECWECHQPPLYYVVAAVVMHAGHWPHPLENASRKDAGKGAIALQDLSATTSFLTLLFWLSTIRLSLTTTYERVTASALATFAPSLLIEGCKIGNDTLVICLASGAVWQLVKWRASRRARHLAGAGAFAALAILSKPSGLVAAAIVFASILMALVFRRDRRAPRFVWGAGASVALLGASLALWRYIVVHIKKGVTHQEWDSMGAQLRVQNHWKDFVSFDWSTFKDNPWLHFDASPARDQFWNYLLRSSLFGEGNTQDFATTAYAYALVVVALALAAFVACGFLICVARAFGPDRRGERELAISALGYVGFLVSLRLVAPYAVHNDFRFIVPIVAPCAVMAGLAFGRLHAKLKRRWIHLAALPGWLVVAFCVASLRITLDWPSSLH